MSTTFTWTVIQMACLPQAEGQTDVVIKASWSLVGVQGQYDDNILGVTEFTYTGGSFTPYDQLTQDQVLGWIWASGIDKTQSEAVMQARLDAMTTPAVVVPPLPWGTPVPEAQPTA